ncbi:Uncharacterised protein [uncultured archaeon]|nr:Uncharacterised protein [uncultured archaeon]
MDRRDALAFLRDKVIYFTVLVLLILLIGVMYVFQAGQMDVESAKVYLQALTAIATLALLYYAYFNVASKEEEDVAQLELALRPIFIWELETQNSSAKLVYKTIKHPLYDFKAVLELGGKEMILEERHLDVSDSNPNAARSADISQFVSNGISSGKSAILDLKFSYHSEVGGRYEFDFTKEVVKKPRGFLFEHRKIVSAKYPWRKAVVKFED